MSDCCLELDALTNQIDRLKTDIAAKEDEIEVMTANILVRSDASASKKRSALTAFGSAVQVNQLALDLLKLRFDAGVANPFEVRPAKRVATGVATFNAGMDCCADQELLEKKLALHQKRLEELREQSKGLQSSMLEDGLFMYDGNGKTPCGGTRTLLLVLCLVVLAVLLWRQMKR